MTGVSRATMRLAIVQPMAQNIAAAIVLPGHWQGGGNADKGRDGR